MKAFLTKNWLLLLIALQPVLDMVAYFQYDSPIGTLAGYIRLVFLVAIPLMVLLKKPGRGFYVLMGLIGGYCLLHIVTGFLSGYESLTADVSYMLKVLQAPVLAVCFCYLFRDEDCRRQVQQGFVFNFLLILVSMVLAYLTKSGVYTYIDYQQGYTGWFANGNSQSIILIILSVFVICAAVQSRKKWLTALSMLLVSLVLLINGTKAAYLALCLIMAGLAGFSVLQWLLEKHTDHYFRPFMILMAIALIAGAIAVYPYTPRYAVENYSDWVREEENAALENKKDNLLGQLPTATKPSVSDPTDTTPPDAEEDEVPILDQILADPVLKQEIIDIYKDSLSPILVEKFGVERVLEKYGWMPDSYTLADVRLQKRINAELIWEESTALQKVFGVEYSRFHGQDLENDYPALYYYYGYAGMGLYLAFLAYFLLLVLRAMLRNFREVFTLYNFSLLLAYGLVLGLAQFSGAIFRRPNASIYLALLVALIFYQCKSVKKRRTK